MDPSIMKKLLEDDEDETMHSGAKLEAFQAALHRDIEVDVSASHPADLDSAVLSRGSNNNSSQSLPELSTASQDVNTAGQIQHDQTVAQHLEMELMQQGSVAENTQHKNDASQELNHFSLHQKQAYSGLQQGQAKRKLLPETIGFPVCGKYPSSTQEQDMIPNLKSESQYLKLQNMTSQQSMITEQPKNPLNRSQQVPFYRLLPLLLPQFDKGRQNLLTTLFGRLRNHEIRKEPFVRKLKSIVGDEMLKMAATKVQLMSAAEHRLLPQASLPKQPPRMLSSSAGATQLTDPRSFALHTRGANSPTDPSQVPFSTVQVQTGSSHPVTENSARKFLEAECHSDSNGMLVSHLSSSGAIASNQERECPSVPVQLLNKPQQQQLHHPQSSVTMHGNTGGTCHPYSGTNVSTCTLPVKPQPPEAELRQAPQHQSMGSAVSGGEAHGTNIMSVSKMERQNSTNDSGRLQGGSLSHFTNNATLQHNPVPWKSSSKEQSSSPLPSMAYAKQESIDQTAEQQHKPPLSNSHCLPSVSTALLDQRNASSGISMDESSTKQSSRIDVSTSPSSSTSTVPQNSVSPSVTMQVNPSVSLDPRTTSGTSTSGINNKTPPEKPSIGQKKPLEALDSSHPQSSKKQKLSGDFSDIEQLNDVTAVSGVNLREEEEQLFSGPNEDGRASEASRKRAQEEEARLILQKAPLQKKLAQIMIKCGLKSVSHNVERCLSLCVEERMRGLINNLIRLSKQRDDAEKSRHRTTSDVRQQIMDLNQKAREECKEKQAEAGKLQRLNKSEVDNGVDGDKEMDEGHPKSINGLQTNKEEDDKMRRTAANVAARAAMGGDDMYSKWQLMAQARKKLEGVIHATSATQPGKDVNLKRTSTTGRIMKASQEADKRGGAAPLYEAGTIKKSGRNQAVMPQTRMARSISVKDIIAVLEREPQMSKSTLIYRLHERIQSDTADE